MKSSAKSLTRADLRTPQKLAADFGKRVKKGAVFAEMGLGKSGASLTVLADLFDTMSIGRALIVAPLRVAYKTWPDEFALWEHARGISFRCLWNAKPGDDTFHEAGERRLRFWKSKLGSLRESLEEETVWGDGTAASKKVINELKREISIAKSALKWGHVSARYADDVHIINRENLAYLVHFWGKYWPYDMVVFDESSGLRNGRKAKRWRAMRQVMPYVDRLIELTGTPAPNGLIGLWGQIYLLDGGKRLGTSMTKFLKTFFYPDDYNQYRWIPKPDAEEAIYDLISDITITLRSADYLDMPPTIYNNIPVVLSDDEMAKYKEMEKHLVLELPDGIVEASNAAVLAQKLMQISNGVVLDGERKAHSIHKAKLDALEEYIEEQQGEPVLIAYWFKEDLALLRKRFPTFAVFTDDARYTDEWNARKLPGMLLHPQSGGHGLNIQFGGRRILWYGPIHDLELYLQLNDRLAGARSVGQGTTYIDHLIAAGTADEQIMESLAEKGDTQNRLLNALKRVVNACEVTTI